jgi:hypothetical protein
MSFAPSPIASLWATWLAATREDPAQDQLRMVIIGLVSLAGVLLIAQVVFWRVTSPRRRARLARQSVTAGSEQRDERLSSAAEAARVSPPPTAAAPAAPSLLVAEPEAIVKIPLADWDAPWPPARVGHRGSSRAARPPDPPGSLFARLAAVVDLDLTPQGARSDVTIAGRPSGGVSETAAVDRPADSLQ